VALLSDEALQTLLETDPERGWRAFVDQYTSTLALLIERAGVLDADDRSDVYVRVCERLAERQCARLRRRDPGKGALAAWLTIVVRHAVVDWIRSRAGRRRLFDSVEQLEEFDRRVFELYYWERHRVSEIVELVAQEANRTVSIADVFDALGRIEEALSHRHRAQLLAATLRNTPAAPLDNDPDRPAPAFVDPRPDPEAALRGKQLDHVLGVALAALTSEDAAIVRLHFVHGRALHEVQRALHLTELPRGRIRDILTRLRAVLETRGVRPDGTVVPGLAVLEDEIT
jgi:RNA polymerase sigma factor (sigma-70 family)